MTQYYFSLASVVNVYKAPNTELFESQSPQTFANVYEDLGKNIDTNFSQYLRDNLSVKQVFLTGDDDFIAYRKATRNWLESTISFMDSAKFKPLNLTVRVFYNTGIQHQWKSRRLQEISASGRIL